MKFKPVSSFSLDFAFCFRHRLQEKQEQYQKLKNYATNMFGIQFIVSNCYFSASKRKLLLYSGSLCLAIKSQCRLKQVSLAIYRQF